MYSRIKTIEDFYNCHIALIAKNWDIEYIGGKCNVQCPKKKYWFVPAKKEVYRYLGDNDDDDECKERYNSSFWDDGLTNKCSHVTIEYHGCGYPGYCTKHKCNGSHKIPEPHLFHGRLGHRIYSDLYDGGDEAFIFVGDEKIYTYRCGKVAKIWDNFSAYLENHDAYERQYVKSVSEV
jgi:hypothetical protein